MPVPNSMADLSTLASSNFPTGTEAIGNNLDNYIRSISAIIRSTNAIASATIASASTTDIGGADGEAVTVTGSATINSFGAGFVGCFREVLFSGTATVVNSASIVLPNATNLTVSAGDVHFYRCTGSGVWRLTGRSRLGVNDVTGLSAALAGKLGNSGDQTLTAGKLTLALAALGTGSGAAVDAYNATCSTANGDLIRQYYYRRTAGSGWGSAEYRIQRIIDGSSFQGFIALNGNDSGNVATIGVGFSDLVTITSGGNLTATGNLISNSDESLKRNWRDLPADFVERLSEVKHGIYDRIDTGATQVGVGAGSLAHVLPHAVIPDGSGILSVAYGNAALVGVIRLASYALDLERRVSKLEGGL